MRPTDDPAAAAARRLRDALAALLAAADSGSLIATDGQRAYLAGAAFTLATATSPARNVQKGTP